MANPPSVEVAIVSFNTRDILRTAIRSLMAHQPPVHAAQLRITVFDNCSSDGSAEMVEAEFPDIEIIRSLSNVGFGAANNIVAHRTHADYLLLLNSDVVLTADIVAPLVAALESNPEAIIASPRLVWPNGQVQFSAQGFPDLAYEFALILRGTRLGRALTNVFDSDAHVQKVRQTDLTDRRVANRSPDSIWATCWLMRVRDARVAGPFSPSFPMYDEDLDFCHRAREGGRTLLYLPEVELVHLGGSSSTSNSKARLMADARGQYYRTHHGRAAKHVYRLGTKLSQACVRVVAAVPRPRRDGRL